jgi:hypothetical protein
VLNVAGLIEVGLDVFGGNNTDIAPSDLPSGLSPDNSDVAFLPGQVFTRPALKRFSTQGTTAQCVYATSFLKPDGTVAQITFMSDGRIYSNGSQVAQTQGGNRFHTCNAFGKLYIAISDGLHGADVPLQLTPEGWVDRVSQDGPGAAPTITNYALPPVQLVAGSSGSAKTITTAQPVDPESVQTGGGWDDGSGYTPPQYETYYTALLFTTTTPHGLVPGETVDISGNTLYSVGTAYVSEVPSSTTFKIGYYTQSSTPGTGGTVTAQAPLLVRTDNSVTAATATPHSLRAGYRVAIDGVSPMTVGGSIVSIVIENDKNPNVATITTSQPHGLMPGEDVTLSGVNDVLVGTSIVTIVRKAGISTLTTTTAHGLQTGAIVLIQTSGGPFLPFTVTNVISTTVFTYTEANLPDITYTGGSVRLVWPGSAQTSSIYSVVDVPSSTTFQIGITYSNGTWTSGTLTFDWNGTFYVTSVLSSTSFTYSQNGPNASIQSGTGTVTPKGQITPGLHSCVQIFLTRTGYLTIPSPPVTVNAGGGQYILLSNAAIGPPNVVARWLAFTPANGGRYFILPVPPRDPAGQFAIGTSTVIPDNVTGSAIFDFSDEALMAGLAIDIPGNNLFRQQVLGPCLGFFNYGSRLFTWGERNKVQLFRNMGFEGGTISSTPNVPLGWTVSGTDGVLTAGDYGSAWQATTATLSQSAFQNQNGTAIIEPNTFYTYRVWTYGTSIATLSSATTGFVATAQVTGFGNFVQANFNVKTPATIPADLTLTISQFGTTTHDEIEIIYRDNPYLLAAKGSYVNNPEAFDGVTSIIGPIGDPHPIMGMQERKNVLCLLTAGPEGSLYETNQTPSGEPDTWDIDHRASKCGLISVWGIAKFEDWFSWASDTGLRIYDGANVEKMSQEIQPWWDSLNPSAKQFTVVANDPYTRRIYVCAPRGTSTVTNALYVLDYRDLNTSSLLANSGTLRVGYTGKVVTTDLTRKWSPWSMTMNYIGLLTLSTGEAVMAFCGGTGGTILDPAHSAVYLLNEGVLEGVDDDYGPFWQNSRYPTYFFVSTDEAEQRQLGRHRLLHLFVTLNATGVGKIFLVPHLDRLGNTGTPTRAFPVTEDLARDIQFGLNNAAERISYSIQCQPAGPLPADPTAKAGFRISSLVLGIKTHPFSPVW